MRRFLQRWAAGSDRAADAPVPPVQAVTDLRVLITQRQLKNHGGSELYAIEVAKALKDLGAKVAVYCPDPGRLRDLLTPSGVPVVADPADTPFVPNLIHGQHHLPTMAALAQFPECPGIYVWHGTRPWVETPPRHPRLRFYLVPSKPMAIRLATDAKIDLDRIRVIPNFVDTDRFSRVRTPVETPTRALLYGQSGFGDGEIAALEAACAAHGLTLDKIGAAYGNPRPRPEYFLPQYDLVFAIGRSAIEAMASGCGVIPVVPQLAGRVITPTRFDDMRNANFSPRYFRSAEVFEPAWLARELQDLRPIVVREVTGLARRTLSLDRAMEAIVGLYLDCISAPDLQVPVPGFAGYLTQMAVEVDAMWGALEVRKAQDPKRDAELAALRRKAAEAETRAAALTDRLLQQGEGGDA